MKHDLDNVDIGQVSLDNLATIDLLEARRVTGPIVDKIDHMNDTQKLFACASVVKAFCDKNNVSSVDVMHIIDNIYREGVRVYPIEYGALVDYLWGKNNIEL